LAFSLTGLWIKRLLDIRSFGTVKFQPIKISKVKHLKLVFTDYRSEDKYLLEEHDCLYLVRKGSSKWRLESPQGYVIAEHKEIDQLNVETFFERNH
jgi:hypothetical protein